MTDVPSPGPVVIEADVNVLDKVNLELGQHVQDVLEGRA